MYVRTGSSVIEFTGKRDYNGQWRDRGSGLKIVEVVGLQREQVDK